MAGLSQLIVDEGDVHAGLDMNREHAACRLRIATHCKIKELAMPVRGNSAAKTDSVALCRGASGVVQRATPPGSPARCRKQKISSPRCSRGNPGNFRAKRVEAFVDPLVTALDLVGVVDGRRTVGSDRSQQHGHAGADIR